MNQLTCLHSVNVHKAQIHSQIMALKVITKDPNLQTLNSHHKVSYILR